MVDRRLLAIGCAGLLGLTACRSEFKVPPAWKLGGQTAAYHQGPLVAAGETGPRRFVTPLLEGLDQEAASDVGRGIDLGSNGWEPLGTESIPRAWKFAGKGPLANETVMLYAPDSDADILVELGCIYGAAVAGQQIPYPSRSLVLLRTENGGESRVGFDRSNVIAEFIFVGSTGGPCTFWRSPDPGGAASSVPANGLNLITRLALVDVGMLCRPWKSVEFAHDGGPEHEASDPDHVPRIYLASGDSGVELARTDRPHVSEAQRACVALWASAAALAGARPTDLDRYLSSILLEARLRHYECEQAGESDEAWQAWLREARLWLRAAVLGLPVSGQLPVPDPADDAESS